MSLLFFVVLLAATIAGAITSFYVLPLMAAIVAVIVGVPFAIWSGVVVYGLVRRAEPLKPFNQDEQRENAKRLGGEGRHITTPDGRIVEYLVYGSNRPDAKVIVQIHGAGMTGGAYCQMASSLCKELNLKGIAPSMPGYGYSDILIGRRIVDFPSDLEVILEEEGVGEFMVEGLSLGTSHAMAVARHFGPDRCVAMGLNVPYLSIPLSREVNVENDADKLPKTDARSWYQAWNFFVADLMWAAPFISPPARHMHRLGGGKKVAAERPWVFKTFLEDNRRVIVRGTQGQGWDQFSYEVNALWGFDPREIETKNVAVWYAKDDNLSPSPHGEWLANYFGAKEGIKVSVRAENAGFGHFTYFPSLGPVYQSSETSIAKTLLELCAQI